MTEQDLNRRVAELEARCRRLRITVLTALCLVAGVGLAGSTTERPILSSTYNAGTIETQRVVLVDSTGARAADLSADSSGVEVRLFRPDLELGRNPDGRIASGEVIDARARIAHVPALVLTDGAGNMVERLGRAE